MLQKFNSSKCESISRMFKDCKNITEIDMLNWNLYNLKISSGGFLFHYFRDKSIDELFYRCKKLNKIKLNTNFNGNIVEGKRMFDGISENGSFTYRKGIKNDSFLNKLPLNWIKIEE